MEQKCVKLDVPIHTRNLLFGKPHGKAYREVLQNYNLQINVPVNPKEPIIVHGLYPDFRYGTRELKKLIQNTLNLGFVLEVIISNTFARELKTKLKNDLENIEINSNCMIEVMDTNLVIHYLEEESLNSAKTELTKLMVKFNENNRPKLKRIKEPLKEPLKEEYQMVDEFWFAKDMRRPAHNVI
ncbi:hypothetical protein LOD99_15773 [Oopsacas minuta]|uniref:Uncharacterized protein n=1 Tax=Oopsacas minuta TaxID=111878 RepID=A0AAV7KBI0_9METZ|nr:hypothetical protein LOD99_15773 [Oopsacas minuta]